MPVSMAFYLFAAQSVTVVPPAPPAKPAHECRSTEGEIVVCGSRKANDRYRLKPVIGPPAPPPIIAIVSIGEGATLSAEAEGGGAAGAEDVPRVMVRFKLKF